MSASIESSWGDKSALAPVHRNDKRYVGYALSISRERIEELRDAQGISADMFEEIIVAFPDEGKTVRFTYSEFKRRLLTGGVAEFNQRNNKTQ